MLSLTPPPYSPRHMHRQQQRALVQAWHADKAAQEQKAAHQEQLLTQRQRAQQQQALTRRQAHLKGCLAAAKQAKQVSSKAPVILLW